MREIVLTKGLPCSGKTTWATEEVKKNPEKWTRVNRDELRLMAHSYKFNKINERIITATRDAMIFGALKENKSVIVDETGLDPKVLARMKEIANTHQHTQDNKVTVRVKEFNITLEEALKRNKERNKYRDDNFKIPEDVIKNMYEKYIEPHEYPTLEYVEQDESLPVAVICDLDGTLAIIDGRSPFDASTCENDKVNDPVAELLDSVHVGDDTNIIFVTGRSDKHKDATIKWLEKLSWFPDDNCLLFMRKEGDMRRDSIIKGEIYNEHINNKYYIRFVLEDRDQMVDFYRKELKLPCFQVNYGDF